MGKDLKGKELGSGIAQRKGDKRYIVSFVKSDGIRIHRSFASLKEAKQWKADITYEDAHQMSVVSDAMTVNAWYASWSKQKEGLVRPNTVFNILKEIHDGESNVKEWTPEEFRNLVFINRTGYPTKNSTYDTALGKRCEKAGIKKVSMHDLRHTFATRFVEASNNYKYLSVMLGHSSIKITMDLYVHQTEESQAQETDKFMDYLATVGIA